MKRELDNETINCGKCQEKMSFNKYHSHLTQNCPCFFIECRMCKEQVVYRDFLNHSQICSKHPVECKCKAILAREDLPLHEKYYCVKSAELLHTDCKICGKSVAITVFQSHYVQEHLKRTMIAQILPKLTFK
jgi:hypothetical protein